MGKATWHSTRNAIWPQSSMGRVTIRTVYSSESSSEAVPGEMETLCAHQILRVIPAKAGIQYSAASPGLLDRPVKPGDDMACDSIRTGSAVDAPPSRVVPLPLSAINVGQDDHQQTFLMLEVGATSLMFGFPPAALEEVGQTLMALSARASTKPS